MASQTLSSVGQDIMVDIETMALTPDALILSIAAVSFEPRSLQQPVNGEVRLLVPNFMDQVMLGRRIDPNTQKWWADAERAEAAAHWLTPEPSTQQTIRGALAELASFVRLMQPQRIWANGAVFDIGILEHAYRSVGFSIPWKYSAIRDSRTIRQELPILDARVAPPTDQPQPVTVPHHPVSDCNVQINDLWLRGF